MIAFFRIRSYKVRVHSVVLKRKDNACTMQFIPDPVLLAGFTKSYAGDLRKRVQASLSKF